MATAALTYSSKVNFEVAKVGEVSFSKQGAAFVFEAIVHANSQ